MDLNDSDSVVSSILLFLSPSHRPSYKHWNGNIGKFGFAKLSCLQSD